MVDLSIIIVSYNVAPLLRECLHSLFANEGVSFEVCVVDNYSQDDSVAMVRREFPRVSLIESPQNGGYAYANNLGLLHLGLARIETQDLAQSSQSPYILLLNPDTVLPPHALREMLDFMEAHPEAGVAGPKLVRPDGSLDLACRRSFPTPEVSLYRMLGLSRLFPTSRRFGRYNLTFLDADLVSEVDSVVGAFMMLRREAIRDVGLLDESFFLYGEDLDWAFRIKEKGWKVLYNPGVVILHHKGESSRRNRYRATLEFYRAMLVFYHKHYARQTSLPLRWLIVAAIYLRGSLAYIQNLFHPEALRAWAKGRVEVLRLLGLR